MPRRYSYDDDRAYEAWLEYREQQEELEAEEAWEAEVDKHCECVYEPGQDHYRYYDWEWVKPVTQCSWHAARGAARRAEEERQKRERIEREKSWRAEEELRRQDADKWKALATVTLAAVAEEIGVDLPKGYAAPTRSLPVYNPTHAWRDQIYYVAKRLYILDGQGLPEELRVQVIGQIFEYLSQPENFGLVRANAKFRAVVAAKVAEFRGDARAEPIKEPLERMDAALSGPPEVATE